VIIISWRLKMTKIYEIIDTNTKEVLNVFRQPIYIRIKKVDWEEYIERIKKAKEEGRNIK